jgi:hypothetical protein
MAQIARGRSQVDPNYAISYTLLGFPVTRRVADMSNEELIQILGSIGQTDAAGTSPEGIKNMSAALGMPVEVKFDQTFNPQAKQLLGFAYQGDAFDQSWLDQRLAIGKKVVVNGAHLAPQANGTQQLIGHYVTVSHKNADGTYAVADPWSGTVRNLYATELRAFMQANETNGGVMMAIG